MRVADEKRGATNNNGGLAGEDRDVRDRRALFSVPSYPRRSPRHRSQTHCLMTPMLLVAYPRCSPMHRSQTHCLSLMTPMLLVALGKALAGEPVWLKSSNMQAMLRNIMSIQMRFRLGQPEVADCATRCWLRPSRHLAAGGPPLREAFGTEMSGKCGWQRTGSPCGRHRLGFGQASGSDRCSALSSPANFQC